MSRSTSSPLQPAKLIGQGLQLVDPLRNGINLPIQHPTNVPTGSLTLVPQAQNVADVIQPETQRPCQCHKPKPLHISRRAQPRYRWDDVEHSEVWFIGICDLDRGAQRHRFEMPGRRCDQNVLEAIHHSTVSSLSLIPSLRPLW